MSGSVGPRKLRLLDFFPNAAVAYSLRKLRLNYNGSAIRVRRSVDNASQDIGFLGNDLDTQTMLDFVGYNLWTYSEDISQAVYGVSRSSKVTDVETAPDGTLTGDKFVEDLTLGEHGGNRGATTILNATSYNISAYFKQGERTKIRIYSNISGANQSCDLDLTNGSVSNSTFANNPIVTAEANGWYRFSVTITSGLTSATFPFQFRTYNASNLLSYTGDGTSGVYVWGYQLSKTSTVKTYQKTVATAGGNGFVSIWYDQSTNGNNAEQSTIANQAQIVLNGNLILDPDTGKITTNWTVDHYQLLLGISPNTKYLSLSVVNRNSGAIWHLGNATYSGVNGQFPLFWNSAGGGSSFFYCMPTIRNPASNTSTGTFILTSEKNNTNQQRVYFNGTTFGTVFNDAPSSGSDLIYLGRSGTAAGSMTAGFSEYIYWNSEQSINRVEIEKNVNNYWGIY